MIKTDYTDKPTFQSGYAQQYRIQKYFKDILNNWFADSNNIKDPRILKLLYNSKGELNKDCIKTGCLYDPDGKYAGTTPAVVVGLGDIQYRHHPANRGGNVSFQSNRTQPPIYEWRLKVIPVSVTVITESYDETVLLTQLIQLFLTMNSVAIERDYNNLSSVAVMGVSAPQVIPSGQAGNAKQLFSSSISITASSALAWTFDTQGPVFKGITVTPNIK